MPNTSSLPTHPQRAAHAHAEKLLVQLQRTTDHERSCRLRDEVVLLTIDLADGVARRFSGRGIDTDDLVQVARLALVKAVKGYRVNRGSSFAAYAVPTITGEIKRHFRDFGWAVRPPRRLQELRADVVAEQEVLRQRFGREPSASEVAASLGVDSTEVRAAQECARAYHALSLDQPTTSGLEALVIGTDDFESVVSRDVLLRALRDLSERERRIVRLRFVDELTQSQIGAVVGVSQMQVSRLLGRILDRLQRQLADPDSEARVAAVVPMGAAGAAPVADDEPDEVRGVA